MNARDVILETIRRQGTAAPPAAMPAPAMPQQDSAALFIAKARKAFAHIHLIARAEDAPEAIAMMLAADGTTELHIAPASQLHALPWHRAQVLVLHTDAPGSHANAFSAADYAIAETGTLAFISGPTRPSSWHFLPGREIVLLDRARILPQLEDVLAALSPLPPTLNLVTGPSRTGDIEQTMELGAHGPRALDILIAG